MMSFSQSSAHSLSEGCPLYGSRSKLYNDPIHGFISLNDDVLSFMDTPQYQRLRDLKQLGTTCFVFPGATHDRLQHSVGVHHVSGCMIDEIVNRQPELDVSEDEKRAVKIAGLCHDLGHGPYSHLFDGAFIPARRPDAHWSHEDMSLKMLDWLIDDNQIEVLDDGGKKMVETMIMGAKNANIPSWAKLDQKQFLFDIVANGKNSIDTDKFDYLARDVYNVGLRSTFDFRRLMLQNRVIGGEICFHAKEVYNVLELFHTRYTLFKQCYIHRAAKAIEFMVTDALIEADVAWDGKISKAIDDPAEYCKLTDHILKQIETSDDQNLEKAQGIIKQFRKRNLYKFVDEYLMDWETAQTLKEVTSEDISGHNCTDSINLHPDDIIVHDHKLNYGNKDQSPLENTLFFNDYQNPESFHVSSNKVSYILPVNFQERILRVYSRKRDSETVAAIQKAFRRFLKKFRPHTSSSPAPCAKSPEPGRYYAQGRGFNKNSRKQLQFSQDNGVDVRNSPRKRLRQGQLSFGNDSAGAHVDDSERHEDALQMPPDSE
eukprot:gb/GECG01001783.1/.p1 GENE.gb/GECG01001783.1/~~gb/GECG01001783.1/.p1  ORF type:complete len:543 (+),score=69.01 gb/GECG01001783.1/:1-1629(+)